MSNSVPIQSNRSIHAVDKNITRTITLCEIFTGFAMDICHQLHKKISCFLLYSMYNTIKMSDTYSINRRTFLKVTLAGIFSALGSPFLSVKAAASPVVLWHGSAFSKMIALTYDDCYRYEWLIKLESILDENPDLKVTLFPVGIALRDTSNKDADLWKRFTAKGHEIGYHGYDHTAPSTLSNAEMEQDYQQWLDIYHQVVDSNQTIRFARPPFGDLSCSFLRICFNHNLIVAMWSTNWGVGIEKLEKEFAVMTSGDIVLFHIRGQDIENTENALHRIRRNGLKMVNLSFLYDYQNETVRQSLPNNRFAKIPAEID